MRVTLAMADLLLFFLLCFHADIPSSEACPTLDELVQFADRYLEWMYVAKSTFDDPSFKLDQRATHLSINDKIDIAKVSLQTADQIGFLVTGICMARKRAHYWEISRWTENKENKPFQVSGTLHSTLAATMSQVGGMRTLYFPMDKL